MTTTGLPSDAQAIINAGAASTNALARIVYVDAWAGDDTKVTVPYAVDQHGSFRFLKEALDHAAARDSEDNPKRRGKIACQDMASLIAWTQKYKTQNTQAYVTAPTSRPGEILVIVDDLPGHVDDATPAPGARRMLQAYLKFELSPELLVWTRAAADSFTAEEFHEFCESHVEEFKDTTVATFARNIEIKAESSWKRTVEADGRIRLVDESSAGSTASVPRKFAFLAPVFDIDNKANLRTFDAQLSLKLEGKKPVLSFAIPGLQREILNATRVMMDQIAKVVPTYLGTP